MQYMRAVAPVEEGYDPCRRARARHRGPGSCCGDHQLARQMHRALDPEGEIPAAWCEGKPALASHYEQLSHADDATWKRYHKFQLSHLRGAAVDGVRGLPVGP